MAGKAFTLSFACLAPHEETSTTSRTIHILSNDFILRVLIVGKIKEKLNVEQMSKDFNSTFSLFRQRNSPETDVTCGSASGESLTFYDKNLFACGSVFLHFHGNHFHIGRNGSTDI